MASSTRTHAQFAHAAVGSTW